MESFLAPLNPAIANPTPIQLPNPMEMYGNYLKNKYLSSEIDKAKFDQGQNNLMVKAWQNPNARDAQGNPQFTNVMGNLADLGGGPSVAKFGLDASTYASNQATTAMNTAKAHSLQAAAVSDHIKNYASSLSGVDLDNPSNGLPQFIAHASQFNSIPDILSLHNSQGLSQEAATNQDIKEGQTAFNGGPMAWKKFMISKQSGAADAYKKIQTVVDQGDKKAIVTQSPFGGPVTTDASLPTSMTPAEELTSREMVTTPQSVGGSVRLTQSPKFAGTPANPAPPTSVTSTPTTLAPDQQPGAVAAKALASGTMGASAKELGNMRLDAQNAVKSTKTIVSALNQLDSNGVITGMGQDWMTKARRLAVFFNIPPPADSSPAATQVFNKDMARVALNRMVDLHSSGIGGRMTNVLLDSVKKANPDGTLEPAAIHQILQTMLSDEQDKIKLHNNTLNNLQQANPQNAKTLHDAGYGLVPEILNYDGTLKAVNGKTMSKASIEHFMANPQNRAIFDKTYGPGSADRILGGTPTGLAPLAQSGNPPSLPVVPPPPTMPVGR